MTDPGRQRRWAAVAGFGVLAAVVVVAVTGGEPAGESAPTSTSVPATTTTAAPSLPTEVPDSIRGMRLTLWSADLGRSTALVLGQPDVVTVDHEPGAVPASVSVRGTPLGAVVEGGDQQVTLLPADGGPPVPLPGGLVDVTAAGDSLWAQVPGPPYGQLVRLDPVTGDVETRFDAGEPLDLLGDLGGRPVAAHQRSGRYGTLAADGTVTFVATGQPTAAGPAGVLIPRCDDGPVCRIELVRSDGSILVVGGLPPLPGHGPLMLGPVSVAPAEPGAGRALDVVDLAGGATWTVELDGSGTLPSDRGTTHLDPFGRAATVGTPDGLRVIPLDGSPPVVLDVGAPDDVVVFGPPAAGASSLPPVASATTTTTSPTPAPFRAETRPPGSGIPFTGPPGAVTTEPGVLPTDVPEALRGMRLVLWSADLTRSHELVVGRPDLITTEQDGGPTLYGVEDPWGVVATPYGTVVQESSASILLPSDGGPAIRFAGGGPPMSVGPDAVWTTMLDATGTTVGRIDPRTGVTTGVAAADTHLTLVGTLDGRPVVHLLATGQYGIVTTDGTVEFLGTGLPYGSGPGGLLRERCEDGPSCRIEVLRPDGSVVGLQDDPFGYRPEEPVVLQVTGDRAVLAGAGPRGDGLAVVDLADGAVRTVDLGGVGRPDARRIHVDPAAEVVVVPFGLGVRIQTVDGADRLDLDLGVETRYVVFADDPSVP